MSTEKKPAQAPSLEELVAKINDSHRRCLKSLRASLAHARRTGNYLLRAQELVGDGQWLDWVEEHCEFSVSQAQRYMRIADRYADLLRKVDDPNALTMTEALKLLSPRKEPGGAGRQEAADPRFRALSQAEVKDRAAQAEQLAFPEDSREAKFVSEKAGSLARQILGLAKKTKFKDGQGQPVEPVQVALALLRQLRRALKHSAVVQVGVPEAPKVEPAPFAKPSANGHNRLNGAAKAPVPA